VPSTPAAGTSNPRIELLKVTNYRVLRDVDFNDLQPLTVLVGPNGSGKSTVFDVFAFLAESFTLGLRAAWDKRGRKQELASRGSVGPIRVEVRYRKAPAPPLAYVLEVDEDSRGPFVHREVLRWAKATQGRPRHVLDNRSGNAETVRDNQTGEPEKTTHRMASPDILAVNALGQLADHPRIAEIRTFVAGWHVSHLSAESARGAVESGPQERLSRSGDNLANVVQYLAEREPGALKDIFQQLRYRVPQIDRVDAELLQDGRLLLLLKDRPFSNPILARYASDGTLKLLAYLILLRDPNAAAFIGIEEPENFLHPRLLYGLAEEFRSASDRSQILATTHSPFFLDALHPKEVRLLWRDDTGYTQTQQLSKSQPLRAMVDAGGQLGDLWMEGFFPAGDPLSHSANSA
jgi:predicted ATPase